MSASSSLPAIRNIAIIAHVDHGKTTLVDQLPWTLVEAEDKRFARLKVLATLVARLKTALG